MNQKQESDSTDATSYLSSLGFKHVRGDLNDGAAPDESEVWRHRKRGITVEISPGYDPEYLSDNELTAEEDAALTKVLLNLPST